MHKLSLEELDYLRDNEKNFRVTLFKHGLTEEDCWQFDLADGRQFYCTAKEFELSIFPPLKSKPIDVQYNPISETYTAETPYDGFVEFSSKEAREHTVTVLEHIYGKKTARKFSDVAISKNPCSEIILPRVTHNDSNH